MADSPGIAVNLATLSTLVTGTTTVTTTGTTVRITATPTPIRGIWLSADLVVGAVITVGDSSVVGWATGMRGIILTPGNPPVYLPITDLSFLWVDSMADGGKLCYAYHT